MTAYRLASGGVIDRSNTLSFKFDGRAMKGYAGETLASALLANDQPRIPRQRSPSFTLGSMPAARTAGRR